MPMLKRSPRTFSDPTISSLIDQAEKQSRGLIVELILEITTKPKEAASRSTARSRRTPEIYRTPIPKFTLEIVKEGYRPYKEEVFLSQASAKKDIILQSIGRTVLVSSAPPAAQVFLDDQDTGKVTDCELPYLAYGVHALKLKKPNWADHEQSIDVREGPGPLTIAATLTVKDYVVGQKMGAPESKLFKLPRAIAIDKVGFSYIADESDFKVKKYDPQGRLQSGWGDAGREFKPLKKPAGIAIDGQGFIYITDSEAACVMKFSKDGKFVAKWGKQGSKPDELMAPLGIAVDRSGDVYVADSGNNRIVKYSTGGVAKQSWGKQGLGRGEFVSPAAVAVNSQNEISSSTGFISRSSPLRERWSRRRGKGGAGDGELNRPLGLAVDAQNYVYVADTGNNRVQKFDLTGRFIAKWGSAGTSAAK